MICRLSLAVLVGVCCAPAEAQSCRATLPGAEELESPSYVVAFRTVPAKVAVGQHFSVQFAVCPKRQGVVPEAVTVDAQMPEHRHGMNYKPSISKTGPSRYQAAGLMFHMPGRWDLEFEVRSSGVSEKLTRSIVLR
jgi:hypothetical protein